MLRQNYPTQLLTTKEKLDSSGDVMSFSVQKRLAMVWPLTLEVYSFVGTIDVESRLQRHITKLIKRKS